MLSTSPKKKQYWYICKKHLNIILDGIDSHERLIIVRDGCYGDCEVENCYDELVVKINVYPWFQIIQSTQEVWYRFYPYDIPDDKRELEKIKLLGHPRLLHKKEWRKKYTELHPMAVASVSNDNIVQSSRNDS